MIKPKKIVPQDVEGREAVKKHHAGFKILDQLTFDITKISKADFIEMGEEFTSKGDRYKRYGKSLVRTELEMFNEIELIEFENGDTNVFFKAPINNVKIQNLANLVEGLHHEFGEDMFGNTGFDSYDENSINRSFWTGRYWNKKIPRISIKLMNDCLELSVLGLKK